jgi:hypothetical protein
LTPPAPGTALTSDQRQQAQRDCILKYTAVGAIGGAALGALFGGNRNQALAGAAVGGVLSAAIAWGNCFSYYSDLRSFPVADAQATRRDTGWVPARGNEVRVQRFSAAPVQAHSGGKVDLDASYYVMAPGDMQDVKVIETRTVSYYDPAQNGWRDLGSVDQTVTASLGTRRAQGSFDLPGDVPPGRYKIGLSVNALGRTDTATQEINVTKA